jgi:hypothetical protein
VKQKPLQTAKKMLSWRGELEGTINTLKQRAQKITRETKLPKISKKLPSWRGELEGTINTPSEGTNNYSRTKTSNNPPKKLPSWRAQIITREPKLPKSANITCKTKLPKYQKKKKKKKIIIINRQVGGDNKYSTFCAIF